MNIQEQINKAESLIQWLDKRIDGLNFDASDRLRLAASCLDMALEHQKAIVTLTANKLYGSAFSLVRLIFEAYVRGVWLLKCATDQEIEKYKTDKLNKSFATLIDEIEKVDGFEEGVMSKVKSASWGPMCSFTHSGILQTARRITPESIEPNYTPDEIIEIIGYSNAFGLLSALQVALLAKNEVLANDLLEKSDEVLCESPNN